jgi:hypothetical protein
VDKYYICIFHADCRLSEKGLRLVAKLADTHGLKLDFINNMLTNNGFQVRIMKEKLGPERDLKLPKTTNCVKGNQTDKLYGWKKATQGSKPEGVVFDIIGMPIPN